MRDEGEQTPEVGAAEWSLSAIQKLLWSRRWLIAAIAAEVFLLTGLVTFLKTPLYEASARLVIERSTPKVMQGEDVVPTVYNEFEIQRFYQTQYLLLRDPALLRQALDRHGVREALLSSLGKDVKSEGDAAAPDDLKLAGFVKDNLKIEQVEYSNMVRVSFRHPSPEVAANVVNAVVETYRDYFVGSGLDARKDASTFLTKAIEDASAEVRALDAKLAQARSQLTEVPASSGGGEMGKSRLESIDSELTQAKARLAKAEAKLHAYEHAPADSIDEVANNQQVQRYTEALAAMRREMAELEGRVGPGWPRLRELREAVAQTANDLDGVERQLQEQAIGGARADVAQEQATVDRLSSLLGSELHQSASAQVTSGGYESIRQEYEQKKSALDRLLARREEVSMSADLKKVVERQVTIVDEARAPERPATPRVRLNLALGLAFGLFLGVAAAFLAEALDNKVRGGAQAGELARLPLLGSIPRLEGPARPRVAFSRSKKGSVAPILTESHHDVEEAFRALRSGLLLSQAGRPPRAILITSAVPGEGKSTVAANFARTLASFGHKTVLLDCDLRHPRQHKVFDVTAETGLTNILAADAPVDEVLRPTAFENLCLVPGGPCPPDPATLLDPERFKRLIAELEDRGFEFVLIDTPPVMIFADTYNLVPAVEGVVLVARAQLTPKDALRQTSEALRKVKAPLLGVVLNGEVGEERGGSYYRYYHYRRGYYGRGSSKSRSEDAAEGADGAAK